MPAYGDLVGDLAAFSDAEAFAGDGGGGPDGAFGVEADAVGEGREGGPLAAVAEGAVGGDVEGGEAAAYGLGGDEGAAVGGDHHAVREAHVVGGDGDGAVGLDEEDVREWRRGCRR